MKNFQYSGIQDKAFLYKKFYNSVEDFIKNTLKIDNFQTDDIFTPTYPKLKIVLSALINYHKFIVDEYNSTKNMREEYSNKVNNVKQLNEEFAKKKEKLINIKLLILFKLVCKKKLKNNKLRN